jgi:CHASE3 domain sensor protein
MQRLEAERVLEWRRIAPGGAPLWLLPDEDLEHVIDQLAASSRARTVEITYYLREYDRRQQRRMNEALAEANRSMVNLTRAVVVLTLIVVVLTAASTVAIFTG